MSDSTKPTSAIAGIGPVLLLTDSDAFAGTERHILDLAVALRELDVDVAVAAPAVSALGERLRVEGVSHLPVEKRGAFDPRVVRMLARRLRDGGSALVHAHNGRGLLHAAAARRLAKSGAVVASQHFITPARTSRGGLGGLVSRRLHAFCAAQTHAHIAVSQAAAAAMLARGDAPADHVSHVPNGIAEPRVSDGEAAAVRRELLNDDAVPLIACAARLQPEKGLEHLVAAAAMLHRKGVDFRLVIAGEGGQMATLNEQVNAANLQDRVRLLGFREDVLAVIAAADLFVLPSLAEPFGLVLLEAMALSRPVVATAAGGPLEIVAEGRTGRLVPPADAAALATAIRELLADRAAAAATGRAGRLRFERHFTRRHMAERTLEVYRLALERSRP